MTPILMPSLWMLRYVVASGTNPSFCIRRKRDNAPCPNLCCASSLIITFHVTTLHSFVL
ncbi:hypothetical protein M758_UG202800 [Ceratodon purpureus]|nr:hypothetical protein M758_UG202800 [Ceratodon purpureus]